MQITDTRIRLLDNDTSMLAVATITIDDCFVVHDLKVINGARGIFVAMPSKKTHEGKFADIAHAINQDTRDIIQRTVLGAYQEAIQNQMQLSDEEAEKMAVRFF